MDLPLLVSGVSVLGLCYACRMIANLKDENENANRTILKLMRLSGKNRDEANTANELSRRKMIMLKYAQRQLGNRIELLDADNDALRAKMHTRELYILELHAKLDRSKKLVNALFKSNRILNSIIWEEEQYE